MSQGSKAVNVCPRVVKKQMSVPGSTLVGLRHLYQGSKAENVCPRATESSPLSVPGFK